MREFWRILTRFEHEKVSPSIGLRNAIGIVVPIAIGTAVGKPALGMIAGLGAMNASFLDGSDPYLLRAQRMLLASVLTAGAIVVGALSGWHDIAALVTATTWAALAGILVTFGTAAADIATLTLVMLLVFSGQPMTAVDACSSGLTAFGGGLLQTLLSVGMWPLRGYEPERRVLGSLYSELSRIAESAIASALAPPATQHATEAQRLLSGLWRTRSTQGERYLSLLAQAERIRLSLVVLARLRHESATTSLQAASRILASVAGSLTGGTPSLESGQLAKLEGAAEHLGEDARRQVEALAGQLRSALELAASSTEIGRRAFERREAARPWQLRFGGTLATLRANLDLRSAAFRHAVRLAACILIGELAAKAVQGQRSYWLPMTIAIVLKPDFTATFSRGVLRLAGTFAGLVLATALFQFATPTTAVEVALLGVLAFVLRSYGPANYGLLVTAVSAMIVLLFALIGQSPAEVIAERGWNTLFGGVLALVLYAVWPTWERTQVRHTMAALLDEYREYFRMVRRAYEEPERSIDRDLDRVRLQARLARSNAEASLERFAAEPGAVPSTVELVAAMLASSHRLVHAVMALEAGLAQSRPLPARPEFIQFANHVELTMHSLAAALRGSSVPRGSLPDLREDHHALMQSGGSLLERYALVNVEADRITNSLNTLTGQVLEFAA
ncbi:MAG TPA: FUSC family protein [Bryobacteraceae bacterium]|nr:FUSC family protein [Bryobacteraceae bacterium]